jgi:hypothetical protein
MSNMRRPLEVCFRHLSDENHSAIEDLIHERSERLDRFGTGVIGCHVTVDRPQNAQRSHNPYRVLIRLTVPPNKELIVSHQPVDLHGSVSEVVGDAFDVLERRLDEYADVRRGHVKAHSRGLAM